MPIVPVHTLQQRMCDQIYNQGSILLLMTPAEETLVSTRIRTQGASSLAFGVFISDPVL